MGGGDYFYNKKFLRLRFGWLQMQSEVFKTLLSQLVWWTIQGVIGCYMMPQLYLLF
jgi:hypothetical protein